jgi:hypothetical protein
MELYKQVKIAKRGYYIACKGLRYSDYLTKRVILGEIASNKGRESSNNSSYLFYKQCDVYLYNYNSCFERFHKEK